MPIPSFTETLGGSLGLGITIVPGGNYFENDDEADADTSPDIAAMNAEVAGMKDDAIIFMQNEPAKEDLSLQAFLSSKEASLHR